jgi:1-deoxy-D-xylulose-5-phosphate reductoisomerase
LQPAILNAANEVAVQAFLDRELNFPDIASVIEAVLASTSARGRALALEDVLAADAEARQLARERIPAAQSRIRGAHA